MSREQILEEFGFSARTVRILRRQGIAYIDEIKAISYDEISTIRSVGIATMNEIRDVMRSHGHRILGDPWPDRRSEEPVKIVEDQKMAESLEVIDRMRRHLDILERNIRSGNVPGNESMVLSTKLRRALRIMTEPLSRDRGHITTIAKYPSNTAGR